MRRLGLRGTVLLMAAVLASGCTYILGLEGKFEENGAGGGTGGGGMGPGSGGGGGGGGEGGSTSNTGGGGHGGSGGCPLSGCVISTTENHTLTSVVALGDDVYWVDVNDASAMTAKAEENAAAVRLFSETNLIKIAVNSSAVYGMTTMGTVVAWPKTSAPRDPATLLDGANGAIDLAASADAIYWLEGAPAPNLSTYDSSQGTSVALTSTFTGDPQGVAAEDDIVYLTTNEYVGLYNTTMSTDVSLATMPTDVQQIAVGMASVFWAKFMVNEIYMVDKSADGAPRNPQIVADAGGMVVDLAAHGDAVYWIVDDRIMRKAPADPMPYLVHQGTNPTSVFVDQSNVYWTDDGAVKMLPR